MVDIPTLEVACEDVDICDGNGVIWWQESLGFRKELVVVLKPED